jgi:hypothetical protein
MRTTLQTASILIALLAAIATGSAATQSNSPAAGNSPGVDMGAISQKLGQETLSLRQQALDATTRLDALEKSLADGQRNTEQATATVDELLKLLRGLAARLSKDGQYAQLVNAEKNTITNIGDRATAHPNPKVRDLAPWYQAKADNLSQDLSDAEQLRTKLLAEIDRLEKEKDVLSFTIAAANIEAFIKDARDYLDILSNLAATTKGLADDIGNAFGTTTPTQ